MVGKDTLPTELRHFVINAFPMASKLQELVECLYHKETHLYQLVQRLVLRLRLRYLHQLLSVTLKVLALLLVESELRAYPLF